MSTINKASFFAMVTMADAFPSKWLKGTDIGDTQPTWTISAYTQEEMPGGEKKWVLFFEEEQKGLVLNRTNADVCAKQWGDDFDDWIGQKIGLFTMPVQFNGKVTDSIRLRVAPRKRPPVPPKKTTAEEIDDELPEEARCAIFASWQRYSVGKCLRVRCYALARSILLEIVRLPSGSSPTAISSFTAIAGRTSESVAPMCFRSLGSRTPTVHQSMHQGCHRSPIPPRS
jgi:hypothetical protein